MANMSNASHRVPAYFEWWYFHFVTEDGVALNIVVHETDIFGNRLKPYVSLTVLVPGDEPQYLRRDLDVDIAASKESYLRVGEGFVSCLPHIPNNFTDGKPKMSN